MQARLNESLAGFRGDHRLQFWCGEGVDVAGLGGHEQHDLRPCQSAQFVSLCAPKRGEREKETDKTQFLSYTLDLLKSLTANSLPSSSFLTFS